ncbi:MAG TPA: Holliday junction branch migration protein RuvA [Patescibacteria group bacterium]|nr:Holliday junction branch migration protein RuvA [Patescibacteria group bacterium]
MITTLNGTVSEKLGEIVVVEVNGVGYGVNMPAEDFNRLLVGDPAKVYVYEHIRENSHDLFGFTTLETKSLFEQLLNVNGVGPKMALNLLSIGSVSQVIGAIASGDVKFLESAQGVGKRVAERVVVDLKDKVGLSSQEADLLLTRPGTKNQDEAVQALMTLGYSADDAALALAKVDNTLSTEERIKQALKG